MDLFESRPDVPLIDRVKIQAEVLVPLIKRLEAELGKERAHDLVREALGAVYRDMASKLATERGSLGALGALAELSVSGDAVDMQFRDASVEGAVTDVTGCRYAQFFQQIGEPELGFLLVCSTDFQMAEGLPGIELRRTQTIMQGAEYCDFRYRFLEDDLLPPPAGST